MMPVMDGFEFLRELRGTPDGRSIPVVVLTARELSAGDLLATRAGPAFVAGR
jgi:CheY-like chemotaxis protein